MNETRALSPQREALYTKAERVLRHEVQVYQLGERFDGLSSELANVTMLDVTEIPGCHYAVKNVFVPIIYRLEVQGTSVGKKPVEVSPEQTILVEPSTGNGWVAFSDAAEMLGYEHAVVMPDGLPDKRYLHPHGRSVKIFRTPKEEYAEGMPKKLLTLLMANRRRLVEGDKIFAAPDHAVGAADITIDTMSDAGRQLITKLEQTSSDPLRVVLSMGNGASFAIGEEVKKHVQGAKVIATESLAYGGGYDQFATLRGQTTYKELFGIDTGNPALMEQFTTYGTNVPIGVELPLQKRAIKGVIDEYVLFTDEGVLGAYDRLGVADTHRRNAHEIPNLSRLPDTLYATYGNSSLANIAVASRYTNSVAMAYDGRENY